MALQVCVRSLRLLPVQPPTVCRTSVALWRSSGCVARHLCTTAASASASTASSVPLPTNVTVDDPHVLTTPTHDGYAVVTGLEDSLSLPLHSFESGTAVGDVELDMRLFGAPLRPDLCHRVVRWQLAKRRTTAYKTKSISETRGGGRKPHPQKGTGRARAGSIRAANWRGGNKAPAVVIRDWTTQLPAKVRKAGLLSALSVKYHDRRLFVIDEFTAPHGDVKTAGMVDRLAAHPWADHRTLLIVDDDVDPAAFLAARNIRHLNLLQQQGANVYDILRHEFLVFTSAGLQGLTRRLVGP